MSGDKTYSKEDISKILNRASEIQTRRDLYGDKDGLTEEELLSVANEVGISKESLLEALDSYDLPTFNERYEWLKATSRLQSIVTTPGEITDEKWEDMVQEIRRVTGGIGKISKVGNTYEWEQRRRDIGYKHISFTPEKGRTKIQLVNSWGGLKFMSTFVSGMIAFTATAVALDNSAVSDLALLFAVGAAAVVGFPMSRLFLKSYYENQKVQVQELVNSLTKKLKSSGAPEITIEEEDAYSSDSESTSSSSQVHS